MASYFRTNLAGDLTGALPQPVVAKIQTVPVSSTAPTTNAVFNYNGSSWIPTITPTITNVVDGYTTTVTAAGTTTLTNASTQQQFFTGTSAQTVRLPQTSTLVLGQSYCVVNNSTALVTVQTFTSNAVTGVLPSSSLYFTVINLASDVAASWNFTTSSATSVTGLTANSFLYGNSSGVLTATASATNGQLLIGNTGTAPVAATLTAGTGVSITNGAGSISVANTGVTSLSSGTTGLSVSASTGAITLSGTLVVSNGGTGQTTFGVGSLLLGNGTTALNSLADVAVGSVLTSGGVGVNPTWTAFTSNATASTVMSRDTSANTRVNNLIQGYTTTATAASTTTLSVASTRLQYFTGTTTQTVRLPVTTTLVNGQRYQIVNTSTGTLTIQTGGAAAITTVPANTTYLFTCISNASDVAASWNFTLPAVGTTGTSLTLTGLTANSFLYSGTGGLLTTTAAPTNGQLLIGSTGAAPVAATLTAGTGILVTNGAGSISIANTGVTSLSTGTTGLSVSGSTGAITLSGTLVVSNGGTGQTTFGVGSLLLGNGTTALSSLADVAVGSVLTSGGVATNPTWTAFTSNATASTVMSRDTSANTRINNLIEGYTTTATAAGTTTLSVASTQQQYFTGATTQTVRLPVTTTLVNGQQYQIVNTSSGTLTIQTGGAAAITTVLTNTSVWFTCINNASDVAASWNFTGPVAGGGTLAGDVNGTLTTSNIVAIDGLPINATTGANSSIYFGYSGSVPTSLNSIGIGYQTLNSAGSITGKNIAIGTQALANLVYSSMGEGNNIAIGYQSMTNANRDNLGSDGSTSNVAIGTQALNAYVRCVSNVWVGSNSGGSLVSTSQSVILGSGALQNTGGSLYSTGTASQSSVTITGVGTTFTPAMVGWYILYSGGFATKIQNFVSATQLVASAPQTVASSTFVMYPIADDLVAVGFDSLKQCRSNRNTAVGVQSGNIITESTYSTGTAGTGGVSSTTVTGVGTEWTSLMIGGIIVFTGNIVGTISNVTSATTITLTVAITVANGTAYVLYLSNGGNTLLGAITGSTLTTGHGDTLLGYGADCGADAINAIAIGVNASAGVAAATNSILMGTRAGNLTMTGASNIGIGSRVLRGVTSGNQNLAVGDSALTALVGGGQNVGLGHLAGTAITSGSSNTVVGANAGASITTLSNNVCVGSGANSSVAGAVALGQGITANQTGGFFVTHRGPITATVNNAGFIAGTNELVELTSSRRFKTNIRDLESVSDKFDRLRPVRFNPIEGHGDVNSEHIGLIAEEVEELWPEFVAHDPEGRTTGINYDRMISVLIKEMQALKAEIKALKTTNTL